jgi:hypothetical protein
MQDRDTEHVERIDTYHWRKGEVDYRLTDIPTTPCHECGAEIGDDQYCYFREDENHELDHICWDCGDEVTGFAG